MLRVASRVALSVSSSVTLIRNATSPPMAPKKDVLKKVPDPPLDTPALRDKEICYSYEIARGEMGVLSFEPYKSLILPFWAFRTVPIAQSSAEALWAIFQSYLERGDFVGSDMTRKYIQMGLLSSHFLLLCSNCQDLLVPGDMPTTKVAASMTHMVR